MLTRKEFKRIHTALCMADCLDVVGRGRLIDLNNTLFLVGLYVETENDAAEGSINRTDENMLTKNREEITDGIG